MENLIAAAAVTTAIIANIDASKVGRPDWKIWRSALNAAARDVAAEAIIAATETAPLTCEDENGTRTMDAVAFFDWQDAQSPALIEKMNEGLCRLCAGQFGDVTNPATLLTAVRTHLTVNAMGCRVHNVAA